VHGEHGLLGRLEHRIQTPQHGHWQDDVTVLSAHVEVAQHVIRNSPNEIGYPAEAPVCHSSPVLPLRDNFTLLHTRYRVTLPRESLTCTRKSVESIWLMSNRIHGGDNCAAFWILWYHAVMPTEESMVPHETPRDPIHISEENAISIQQALEIADAE